MTFEEERIALFAALGEALDAWTNVETNLYLIFLGCLSPGDHNVAAAVYYATQSFRTKLDLTDAAMKAVLDVNPAEPRELEELLEQQKRLLEQWEVLCCEARTSQNFAMSLLTAAYCRIRNAQKETATYLLSRYSTLCGNKRDSFMRHKVLGSHN